MRRALLCLCLAFSAAFAFVLADALLEKTGGDSMDEVLVNLDAFRAAQKAY